MEKTVTGSIRTAWGVIELIPQDRNLLQASSVEPLQFGDVAIHLWAMLERGHETWRISGVVEPLLDLVDGFGLSSSIAGEPAGIELLKSVLTLAGEWAGTHPEAFERAAAEAFKSDKEGLSRELGALRESLTCSAQAIESITAEAPSAHSGGLRVYSQNMRTMASDVPAMQKITQAISFPREDSSRPTNLLRLVSGDTSAVNAKTNHLGDGGGRRKNPNQPVIVGVTGSGQDPSADQLTLGRLLKKQRQDIGLSQQQLALKLGVKASHVAQLETDCGPRPSFQLLSRVANVLELDKETLFKLAETGANSPSSKRKAASRRENRVWTAFAHNHALLDRHNVKPQELEALSQVSLMGKITRPEALLFILNAIRDSGDTEE
jgi:transcriptional regulator with XRE-family HTH domain